MAITKERKDELVAQYAELLDQSNAIILTDYSGLNVKQMQMLRAQVRQADAEVLSDPLEHCVVTQCGCLDQIHAVLYSDRRFLGAPNKIDDFAEYFSR